MKLALFAADDVGLEVTRLLRDEGDEIACLVVDARDARGVNAAILEAYGDGPRLTSDDLRAPDGPARLAAAAPDLGLSAWWPYLLKPAIFETPRLGFLNFHPALLPAGRGRHPNFWSLVEGTPFGVTIHHIDAGCDTGDIAWQAPLPVTWEDDARSLHHRAKRAIVDLFRRHLPEIRAGAIPRRPQAGPVTAHRAAELEPASEIDLEKSYTGREILNLLRARTYPPHPGAWFIDDGRRYEARIEIRESDGE